MKKVRINVYFARSFYRVVVACISRTIWKLIAVSRIIENYYSFCWIGTGQLLYRLELVNRFSKTMVEYDKHY